MRVFQKPCSVFFGASSNIIDHVSYYVSSWISVRQKLEIGCIIAFIRSRPGFQCGRFSDNSVQYFSTAVEAKFWPLKYMPSPLHSWERSMMDFMRTPCKICLSPFKKLENWITVLHDVSEISQLLLFNQVLWMVFSRKAQNAWTPKFRTWVSSGNVA